jgi:hypothetical protein
MFGDIYLGRYYFRKKARNGVDSASTSLRLWNVGNSERGEGLCLEIR